VRITAPPGVAFDFLVPFAEVLGREYPSIELEILATIPHLDLSRGDAELAIRLRAPEEPELSRLYTRSSPVGIFGNPRYLASLTKGAGVADLEWITWSYPNEHLPPRPQLEAMIPNFRPKLASNDFLVQKHACEHGLGVMLLERARHPLIDRSRLMLVPVALPVPETKMHLVCAKSMEHVPRVRAVANVLIREFERIENY
jgi:DNA-binding transcriptional LysR family regulator